MKRFGVTPGLIFASWALLLIFGCHKKKPSIAPEEAPPTLIAQIPTQSTEPPAGHETDKQSTNTEEQTNAQVHERPTHKPPKHPRNHPSTVKKPTEDPEKAPPTVEAKNLPPPKVIIQEGASGSTGQAASSASNNSTTGQTTTQQLLDGTENNLHNIKRQLSADEQSMVEQIRDYIKQSKEAAKDGDNMRAYNLALKARLLSDELVKAQ